MERSFRPAHFGNGAVASDTSEAGVSDDACGAEFAVFDVGDQDCVDPRADRSTAAGGGVPSTLV